jgi:tRNA G10  N-methylase Trm11
MDKFLFVLGSNFQLSLAELDNVLQNSKFKGKIVDYSANVAVVEFDNILKEKHYINELMELQYMLGGCQKIVKIFDFIHINILEEAFPLFIEKYKQVSKSREKILEIIKKILPKVFPKIRGENIFFAVSIYPNFYDENYYTDVLVKHFLPFLNTEIMNLLLKMGAKKSLYYKYPEKNIKKGNLNPIFPHHLIKYGLFNKDRAEIVFAITEEGLYIGRTFVCDDPNFKRKIDEEKPSKEFKSAISPKLALMLLNFLNLFEERNKKKILDPFVGNGTIILFGVLEDFDVYGSDIDAQKVESTLRNVKWLLNELEEPVPYLLNERIKNIELKDLHKHYNQNFFDGICSEPDLGPFYTTSPTFEDTMKLIENQLNPLYSEIFDQARFLLKPNHRIVITAPIISTLEGEDLQLNIEKIAAEKDFKLIPVLNTDRIINKSDIRLQFKKKSVRSLIDAKKGQVIKRKIYIFEKL